MMVTKESMASSPLEKTLTTTLIMVLRAKNWRTSVEEKNVPLHFLTMGTGTDYNEDVIRIQTGKKRNGCYPHAQIYFKYW